MDTDSNASRQSESARGVSRRRREQDRYWEFQDEEISETNSRKLQLSNSSKQEVTRRAEEVMQMPADTPEEICGLFQNYMAEGDIDAVLSLYDPEAVFLNQAGEATTDRRGLRQGVGPSCRPEASLRFYHQAGHPDRRHRADAHGVEGLGAAANGGVCDRGCAPTARREMVLAYWRPLHCRQGGWLVTVGRNAAVTHC